jgi:hypothetical protein
MIVTTWRISRLSREWVGPVAVTADGLPVIDWAYAILPAGERPATPESIDNAPTVLDDTPGILVGPGTDNVLSAGRYVIWVRYVAGLEAPVLNDVGVLVIT